MSLSKFYVGDSFTLYGKRKTYSYMITDIVPGLDSYSGPIYKVATNNPDEHVAEMNAVTLRDLIYKYGYSYHPDWISKMTQKIQRDYEIQLKNKKPVFQSSDD